MATDNNDAYCRVRQYALAYLARREYSALELSIKLQRKGFVSTIVMQVLQDLQMTHLQSDQRYAAAYVRHKVSQGFGPHRIRPVLLAQGIANEQVNELLDKQVVDWLDVLQRLYCKRFREQEIQSEMERAKRMRYLYQRGFDMELITEFFKQSECYENK